MAVAFVASVVKLSTLTSDTLAYSPNPVSSSALLVFQSQYSGGSAPTINTPTDGTHTYLPAIAQHTSVGVQAIRAYYTLGCTGGARTVTFSGDASTQDMTCVLAEFAGVAAVGALDQTGTASGTGTAVSVTSGATTQAAEVVLGIMTFDGLTTTITQGQTIIQENEANSTTAGIGTEYEIVTTTGAKASTWTLGASRAWIADNFTLKAEIVINFDAASKATAGTGSLSWTHTPTGTPRGVVVMCVSTDSADAFTGVTYGGVAMVQMAGSPNVIAGEVGEVAGFFLGSGVPPGAQTVAVTKTGTGTGQAYATTVTTSPDADVLLQDVDATINSTAVANPAVTLGLGGLPCLCVIGFYSGGNAPTNTTPFTNWTSDGEEDLGADTSGCYHYNVIARADVSAGWTQASDDAGAIAVALTPGYILGLDRRPDGQLGANLMHQLLAT